MPETSPFFNPFDFTKLMTEFDPTKMMTEFTKALNKYTFPSVDMNNILESQRKNVEALAAANKVVLEGAQAVVTRQSEILQQTMEQASTALKELSSAASPQETASKEAELVQQAFEKALANMRELAEITAKSNTELMETINKRIAESLDEIKELSHKSTE